MARAPHIGICRESALSNGFNGWGKIGQWFGFELARWIRMSAVYGKVGACHGGLSCSIPLILA